MDVKVPERDWEFVRKNMVLELAAEAFLDEDVSADLWESIDKQKPAKVARVPEPETSGEDESVASSIETSGTMPSQNTSPTYTG